MWSLIAWFRVGHELWARGEDEEAVCAIANRVTRLAGGGRVYWRHDHADGSSGPILKPIVVDGKEIIAWSVGKES